MEESKLQGIKGRGNSGGDHHVLVQEEEEDVVFPGFRFHPTDEELVSFYLRRKVEGKALNVEIIKQIDIYKYEPWDLPKATHFGGEKEWYFFCLRGRKYRNSIRPNRVTGSGFWKATGIDRPIYSSSSENGGAGDCIGLKKSLVYYQGSAGRGTKTDWMMHEFRLPLPTDGTNAPPNIQGAEIWTICRIFQREISYNKKGSSQQDHAKGPLSSNRRSQYQRFEHYQCHYSTCSTSITNSFESDARDERASDSHRPFVLTGFNDVVVPSTAAVPETSTVAAWSELGFRDGYSWDELGRIVELMNDPSNHV